jgi:hypothetical protein
MNRHAVRVAIGAAALAVLGLGSVPAAAHAVSTAYLRLATATSGPTVQVDLPLRDLEDAVGLDANGDGRITWGEVRAAEPRISAWIAAGIAVRRGAARCEVAPQPLALETHAGTVHASIVYALGCAGGGEWSVDYALLFDRDRTHRALLAVGTRDHAASATAVVLDAGHRGWRQSASAWSRFVEFVRQGVWHIWLGYDHLAFLLLLLLPAVLERERSGWVAARSLRAIAMRTLGVVTAFTLAHSITLSLAALGILTPPTVPVEAGIAATVVLAGLANLIPRFAAHGARMAFGFGLIHGFGFANALRELGLIRGGIAAPLAGFNGGVELGQLAVVAVALPVLVLLRQRSSYHRLLMPGTSAAVASIAGWWLLQRVGVV